MSTRADPWVLRSVRLVWAAMLVAPGLYLARIASGEIARARPLPDTLEPLIGAALAGAISSFLIPALLRRASLAKLSIPTREVPDPDAVRGPGGAVRMTREYVDPIAARRRATGLEYVPFVLSLALSLAVTLVGLFAAAFGHPFETWAPFFVCGMALVAIRFPTERSLYGHFEAKTGIPLPR
ncbi:MAG: hypothetical protein M3Y87_22660 [Myxococcota bacterium]|nr:hypothetical protein [Myxococcota bacterium]